MKHLSFWFDVKIWFVTISVNLPEDFSYFVLPFQDNQGYMLKTVIDTRRNDDIRKVLVAAKGFFHQHRINKWQKKYL